eukprot:2977411-Pyramimonas_sp.AAC.1
MSTLFGDCAQSVRDQLLEGPDGGESAPTAAESNTVGSDLPCEENGFDYSEWPEEADPWADELNFCPD